MSVSIDPRIRNLSYSSLLTLHTCPREYQLYKLQSSQEDRSEDTSQSVTFAYGHIVGSGIQGILESKSLSRVTFDAFLQWEPDLFADNPKQNKSFWSALHAINQFSHMRDYGFLSDWELVEYQGKPASELSFCIILPDGFKYRGFVDAVLHNRVSGEVMVLECKTTSSANLNPAQYKNSAQAIGYSIVLDAIFPELSAYKVLYLAYQTKSESFIQLPFDKSYYQRALWINELLLDVEMIKMYEAASIYPMHGESCFRYFRECGYYNTCTLSTERLKTELTPEMADKLDHDLSEFQIQISLEDLIRAQLGKNVTKSNAPASLTTDDDLIL